MKPASKLVLFKRHAGGCPVTAMNIPASAKRYYFDCDCLIWVVGRTPQGDIVPRQSTGVRDVPSAEKVCADIVARSAALCP